MNKEEAAVPDKSAVPPVARRTASPLTDAVNSGLLMLVRQSAVGKSVTVDKAPAVISQCGHV